MFGSKFINATVFPFLNHNTIQLHSLGTRIPNIQDERQYLRSAETFRKNFTFNKPSVAINAGTSALPWSLTLRTGAFF